MGHSATAPPLARRGRGLSLTIRIWATLVLVGLFALLAALPAAAAPWLPATVISEPGSHHSDAQVKFDGAGNATAVFRHDSDAAHVQAAEKPAGGAWQAPFNLSSSPYSPQSPQIAINPAGDAVVVWTQFDDSSWVVRAAVRRDGGPWLAPVTISQPGVNVRGARVAIGPSGAAVVVWERLIGDSFSPSGSWVQAAAMTAAGIWQTPTDISLPGDPRSEPAVALDSEGVAAVAWQRYSDGNGVIEASEATLGGSWAPPVEISAPGVNAIEARLAADAQGGVVAVWARHQGNWVIQGSSRASGGSWAPPADISATDRSALSPQLAVDASGDAIAVWQRHVEFSTWIVQSAGGSGNVWELPVNLSTAGAVAGPQVATDSAGNAVVSWIIDNQYPQVATKTANGGWQPSIYVPDYPGSQARVAVDSNGNAIVLSQRGTFTGLESAIQATEHRAIRLSVTKSGSGSGTVSSAPAGIDCGFACSAQFEDDSTARLTAAPAAGSTFTGWSGACTGLEPCTVTMTSSQAVEANFTAETPPEEPVAPPPATPPPVAPAQPPVSSAAQACPAVSSRAGTFVPVAGRGRKVAGVRARVGVGTPSRLVVDSRLSYRKAGRTHRVLLAPLSFRIATARNLRIPLPAKVRGALPLGTRVKLTLRISATADSAPACGSAAVSKRRLKVRVVRVLAAGQAGIR